MCSKCISQKRNEGIDNFLQQCRRRWNFFESKVFNSKMVFFSVFSCFCLSILGFWKRRNFSPKRILPIKPIIYVCPCSRTVGMSKKIWIQTYFGSVTVYSEEVLRHFAFWRHGSRLATFFITAKHYIFCGASESRVFIEN